MAKTAKTAPTPAPAAAPAKAATIPTVTLKQIAAQIAEQRGSARKDAEETMAALVAVVVDHLKTGSKVRLNGLGILQVKSLPARTGRNPGTGESIEIKASKKIAFRVAKELKEAV